MSTLRLAVLIITFMVLISIFESPALFSREGDFPQEEESSPDEEFQNRGWYFKINGCYKNLFMYQHRDEFFEDVNSLPEEKRIIADLNRIRVSPEIVFEENFIFHVDADFEGISTNYNRTTEFDSYWRESDYNDFVKPSWESADNRYVYGTMEFLNIYTRMAAGDFTGTAGRQQVRFGSSRLWNPLDLLTPLSPLYIEGADEAKGVDALRLDWYPGESTELTGVVNPRREHDSYDKIDAKSGNYILRLKSGIRDYEAAILSGYTSKRKNYGADFTAVINDGLLTGVFLCSIPDDGEKYYQCGAGYEYTFASGIYFLAEYFYNSSPVNDDDELAAALYRYSDGGIDEKNCYIISNRIVTYNRHYLSVASGYDFFPLLRGDLFSIYDFQGKGIFLNASLKFNAMENLDLTGGIITAFVSENSRTSDFVLYDEEPMFYGALQFYF